MEKSTIEKNKLIANYMGGNGFYLPTYPEKLAYIFKEGDFFKVYHLNEICYHKDWNWIMPVLKKIEEDGCIVEITLCLATNCKIIKGSFKKAVETIANTENENLIQAIYDAVVEYVKWKYKL